MHRSSSLPAAGGYRPFAELGSGGMGRTFIAQRPESIATSFVVIKRPHAHLLSEPSARQRFHHEAALASAVTHPNLVRTMLSGEDQSGPYIIIEYVHGLTLMELVDRALLKGRHLSVDVLCDLGLKCASGLAALHSARDPAGALLHAVHRDISPQNILVMPSGGVKLGDFGAAKSALSEASTDARSLIGKLSYLPPEYLTKKTSTPALDVYALGISLYVAALGHTPFRAGSERELLREVLSEPFPRRDLIARNVSRSLVDLLSQMCAKDPELRPTSEELREVLTALSTDSRALSAEIQLLAGNDLDRRWNSFQEQARSLHL